jgi:AP-4 complex subunit epsilon-1
MFLSCPLLLSSHHSEVSGIQLAAANAVIYQCITAITKIVPNSVLLSKAAEVVSRFMKFKDNNNIKYLGLKCLIDIIHINPQYALEHQNEVGCG